MRTRPKYQVFISSTYGDLRAEREAVTWVVLSARHIPAGMENFTATDDRGWQTIKSVIDTSDYYVLIIAGRYGSVDVDGKSWTEKEYDYAVSRGIPVLAFVRSKKSITADMVEEDPKRKAKLENFVNTVRKKHLCSEWSTKEELVGQVSNALRNHIMDDEDQGRSRPGWYRGDELPSQAALEEFARLSKENARLQAEIEAISTARDTTPYLILVDENEQTIKSQITKTQPLKIYHTAYTTLKELHRLSFGGSYLIYNTIKIFELGVQNSGNSLIEHVTVDLSLKPIRGFHCGWDAKDFYEVNSNGRRLTNFGINPDYRANYPEVITLVNSHHIKIRIRVSKIPAGGTEYLPALVVLGTVDVEEQRSWFELNYKISGSVGAPNVGSIHHEIIFNDFVRIDKETEAQELSELKKYNIPYSVENMYLKTPK
jgi:hypothetical protein